MNEIKMTRQELLEILKTLSMFEGFLMSSALRNSDQLFEKADAVIDMLQEKIKTAN